MNVDVSLNSSVEEFARAVKEKKGVPDIIVNCAGTINGNNKLGKCQLTSLILSLILT